MTLSPEQSSAVSSWIAAGDSLSAVQRKLRDQYGVSLTFMEVRFLVDDLNLQLKDPAPKVNASDVTQPAAAPSPSAHASRGPADSGTDADAGAMADDESYADEAPPAGGALPPEDELPGGASSVTLDVDKVTLHPGALASGSVTFSDGVTAKWIIDNYGRPGFTEVSQPGYRPKPADAQAFMQQLSAELQKRGF
ncbi:MAG: hypothetical protein ACK5CF_02525 [Opitutaceae bacterium]